METPSKAIAEIHYSKDGPVPHIELLVPKGTHLGSLGKITDMISKEIISKISPRGCTACTSGTHLIIREQLENVVRVDLNTGRAV